MLYVQSGNDMVVDDIHRENILPVCRKYCSCTQEDTRKIQDIVNIKRYRPKFAIVQNFLPPAKSWTTQNRDELVTVYRTFGWNTDGSVHIAPRRDAMGLFVILHYPLHLYFNITCSVIQRSIMLSDWK